MAAFGPEALLSRLQPGEIDRPLLIAYSGGADSLALLLGAARAGLDVEAVHVDHHLHPDSGRWAALCVDVCARLQIPLRQFAVEVISVGEGLEAAARRARYTALAAALIPGDLLLTAHHAEDQAETVLLRALRGTGPEGLAAMPRRRPLGAGTLLRPLLDVRRAALRAYAVASGLPTVADPANTDPRHERSWLRQDIMPVIAARSPRAVPALNRLAGHAAELSTALDWLLAARIDRGPGGPLPCATLLAVPAVVRRLLLRHWLRRQGVVPPGERRLRQGLDDLLMAGTDAEPRLCWSTGQIRRYAGELYLLPPTLPAPLTDSAEIRVGEGLEVPSLGRLAWQPGAGMTRLEAGLRLEARHGGERLRVGGRRRRVKELLRVAGLPPWERARLPLLHSGGEVVAIPGITVADSVRAAPDEPGLMPAWTPAWRLP